MRKHELLDKDGINYSINVTGDYSTLLEGFLIMVLTNSKALHYKIEENKLYLKRSNYQAKEKGYIPLPFPLDAKSGFAFVKNWLENLDTKLLSGNGQQLGFTVESKDFGEFDILIEGTWIYYGK